MQRVTPPDTTVAQVCRDLGFTLDDDRLARTIDPKAAEAILARLRKDTKPVPPQRLGAIGPTAYHGAFYKVRAAVTEMRSGAQIPYVVEVWASCTSLGDTRPREHQGQAAAKSHAGSGEYLWRVGPVRHYVAGLRHGSSRARR